MRHEARGYFEVVRQQLRELFTPGSAQNRRGQELVEYALLLGFVAVAIAATVPYQVTAPLSTIFSKIQVHLNTHGG